MFKKIILLLFILQFASTVAQELPLKATFIATQKMDADVFVGFDGMENSYYIKNNVFYKQYKQDLWQYKNLSLGKITRVDIQNPLNSILFYENFNTVVMLDNQLNETQKINFSENSIPIIATAVGISSQNRLWVYNSLQQQIGLFDYLKSNFLTITPLIQGNLKYYESDYTTFQWIDDSLNWYSCDVFGKISTLGKLSDFDQIQIISNQVVIFSKDGKLYLQDIGKKTIYTIENVEKSFKNFYYKDQILATFTNQEITNYKISIP